eukprot:Nk52_evm34s2506 gene=Nk52_evmTU34s2506
MSADPSSDPPELPSSSVQGAPEPLEEPFRDSGDEDGEEAIEDNLPERGEGEARVIANEEEEGEGEDLFGDEMERDYRAIPHLDTYDAAVMDHEEYSPMGIGERRRLEAAMDRDRNGGASENNNNNNGRRGDVPAAMMSDSDNFEDDMMLSEENENVAAKRRRKAEQSHNSDVDMNQSGGMFSTPNSAAGGGEGGTDNYNMMTSDVDDDDEDGDYDLSTLENRHGLSTRDWVIMPSNREKIGRCFMDFLQNYTDDDMLNVHADRVRAMAAQNGESLVIKYRELVFHYPLLGIFVADAPAEMLKIFDERAKVFVKIMFPEYEKIHADIHVRISDLPVSDHLRHIRQIHLNSLIKVCGVVTRRTGVFPQLQYVKYDCTTCGMVLGPYQEDANNPSSRQIDACPQCQSRGPFTVNVEQTVYRNFQKITLQESPGTVPAGRLPRQKEVILLWDLVDSCKPGDEIEVTGIYRNNFDTSLNLANGFPVFSTLIEANYIKTREDQFDQYKLTEEDVKEIRELAKKPNVGEMIINAVAPSIHGHSDIKTAIAMAMFGGQEKNPGEKHRIRGDINVLLLGDPGTAKSQFLKYVEKTAHRTVFTTGQGASAVGLTASVRKDPITREWTLEGGALVLADKGICLIDEFDKMTDQDRTSIHEAMEQQSISISKAGIITSLQARCCIIAAANPIKGRYDQSLTFSQNVELTEPIISRFDVLCVVRDNVDPIKDEELAGFVVDSHIRHHPINREQLEAEAAQNTASDASAMSQATLKKYLLYAKMNVRPKLHGMDQDKIATLYGELRRESMLTGSIPITVRYVESVIRLAEAHARMHLREYVRDEDVSMAIRVALDSFISTQKYSAKRELRKTFNKYLTYKKDHNELLNFILQDLVRKETALYRMQQQMGDRDPMDEQDVVEVNLHLFEERAKQMQINDLTSFFNSQTFKGTYNLLRAENKIIKRML